MFHRTGLFITENRQFSALANDITERVLLEEKLAEEKIKKQQEITAAVITAQAQERTFLGENCMIISTRF